METLFHKYLEKAREELCRGRIARAEEAIASASYMHPGHVDVICCRVEVLRAQGRFQEAAICLQKALKQYPYHPWWVIDLADLLINRLQEPALALDWLVRLLNCCELSAPQKLRAFRLQAEALIDQERLYEASLSLHTALAFFPRDMHLLFLRGWVCLQRGNSYGAASAFHSILRRDPEHGDAHYYLGLAFAALGELRLMQCHFEQAYTLDQADTTPLRYSADAFERFVQQSLSCESLADIPEFHVHIQGYPTLEMLGELGLDPRQPGFLQPPTSASVPHIGPLHMPVLILFQRNIERFCCSEREMMEEIQQLVLREWAHWGSYFSMCAEEPAAAVSSG